jgi:hypothetical protein
MDARMQTSAMTVATLDELKAHVRNVLCLHDRLDARQIEMRQAWITRAGQRCGLWFQVTGPRQMRTYAIWSEAEQRILFYESKGERFAESKLGAGILCRQGC